MSEYIIIAAKQSVAVFAGCVITHLWTALKAKKDEIDAKDKLIEELLENDKAQLRNDIITAYMLWQPKKYMPSIVKESLINCYTRYKANGGNGYIDSLMKEIKEFPTEVK